MQYNESEYNGDEYNLTNYTQTLVETITPTDATVAKSVSMLRTDSQGTADVISDGVSLTAFLETVSILQRAKTPFAYNNGMYNQYMYNARLDEDEILLLTIKALNDSISSTDFLQPFSISKVLLETLTETDVRIMMANKSLLEFLFLSEFFQIEITNKALNDTVRLADWLTIKQNPQTIDWYD